MINETLKKMKNSKVVSTVKVQTGKVVNVGITPQGGGYIRPLTKKEIAYQSRLSN
jgi:hypothetical protein